MSTATVTFQTSEMFESSGEGKYLKEPGTYHLLCNKLTFNPPNKEGTPLEGFRIEAEVLAGTTDGQEQKLVDIMLFDGKPTHKDQGASSRLKQTRALVALGLIHPTQIGQAVSIDPDAAVGRQFFAVLAKPKDSKYLELNYSDIFHFSDPKSAAFPRNAGMAAMVQATDKLPATVFEAAAKKAPAEVDMSSI